MANSDCLWLDLEFELLGTPDSTDWNAVGGLYVFAGRFQSPTGILQWRALYIGECRDFSDRLPTHEKWSGAVRLGATHVHARVVDDEKERAWLQKRMILTYQPRLNVQ